jgi:hypothetical protein
MIETIYPKAHPFEWPDGLLQLARRPRRRPFDPAAVAFVHALSSDILRSGAARRYPELAALAHWFRHAGRDAVERRVGNFVTGLRVRPRGLVFIVAPSNVEVLFIYGWLLSMLAGNGSIVRLSQKPSEVRDAFFEIVEKNGSGHPSLEDSWLVTYPHDDAVTAKISAACDARIVWGGDATIAQLRAISLNPLAVEAGFADRFSFAAFAADRICADSDERLSELARRFVNDTLWFSQLACSSPRAVVWVGDEAAVDAARRRFWPLYLAAAAAFENEPAAVVSRVADLFMLAGAGAIEQLGASLSAFPGRAMGRGSFAKVRELHSGHGLFVEYIVGTAADIIPLLEGKDQTLVVYGLGLEQIETLIGQLPNRALDRIVSPGQATDFSIVWDGSDLFDILTRKVEIPPPPRASASS